MKQDIFNNKLERGYHPSKSPKNFHGGYQPTKGSDQLPKKTPKNTAGEDG